MHDNDMLDVIVVPNMDNDLDSIFASRIRHVIIEGECWWSIYDLYALAGRDSNPSRDWAREKSALLARGYNLPDIRTWNFHNSINRRARATPLINQAGISHIRSVLGNRWPFDKKPHGKYELSALHPIVKTFLEYEGFSVSHHYLLPSGKTIDFLAKRGDITYIVECKPYLSREIFSAVGQVLSYCAEYGKDAKPLIMSSLEHIDEYAKDICAKLKIKLIGINEKDELSSPI